MRIVRTALTTLTAVAALAACSGTETAPENHTPHDAQLFLVSSGAELTPTVHLPAGQTVRVEVRFVAEDGDVITGIETEHFASLSFNPGTLATVAGVTGHHFQFDVTVTGTATATGTVTIGYGHDVAADELSFGPKSVQIQ